MPHMFLLAAQSALRGPAGGAERHHARAPDKGWLPRSKGWKVARSRNRTNPSKCVGVNRGWDGNVNPTRNGRGTVEPWTLAAIIVPMTSSFPTFVLPRYYRSARYPLPEICGAAATELRK